MRNAVRGVTGRRARRARSPNPFAYTSVPRCVMPIATRGCGRTPIFSGSQASTMRPAVASVLASIAWPGTGPGSRVRARPHGPFSTPSPLHLKPPNGWPDELQVRVPPRGAALELRRDFGSALWVAGPTRTGQTRTSSRSHCRPLRRRCGNVRSEVPDRTALRPRSGRPSSHSTEPSAGRSSPDGPSPRHRRGPSRPC